MHSEMNPLVERYMQSIAHIRRHLFSELSERTGQSLTQAQFGILKLVKEHGPVKSTLLADLIGVKPSAITVMIDRMETSGVVSRETDPQDRRVVLIRITTEGTAVLEQLRTHINSILTGYFQACSMDELEQMARTLEKIAAGIPGPTNRSEQHGTHE